MLEIQNLTLSVAQKTILKNINLKIDSGEIHVLMGPNGVGKSTICKSIMQFPGYTKEQGQIIFDGEDITNAATDVIAKQGIMYIMQSPTAVEGVTNAELLRTALSEKSSEHVDIFKFNKELETICQKISLPKTFIHRSTNDGMSGGERKKNELLHMWILKPKLLLLDEIDSGLDIDALKIVANSIKEYHQEFNASIILITHNPQLLEIIQPDYIHILKNQRIVKTGGQELIKEIMTKGFETNVIGENTENE